MSKKIALVTGSTSGIGLSIAKMLIDQGYTVAFHSRSSVDKGKALAAEYEACSYHQADLAKEVDIKCLVADVVQTHGQLDVLVNNAGISAVIDHSDLKAASADVWRQQYEVNVIAPWLLITEAEPYLRLSSEKGKAAAIVNISTHASIRPKGASIPYAASKAALNHMSKLLALNLGPDIRVNGVAPGLVDTPLSKDWQAARDLWNSRSPMKRQAQPEDIAEIVLMLINNDYITGEIIIADGGLNLT